MTTDLNRALRQYLAALGSKGGKATGKSKIRGNSDHYRQLAMMSAAVRRAKAKQPQAVP
jgi:hypothetical protein